MELRGALFIKYSSNYSKLMLNPLFQQFYGTDFYKQERLTSKEVGIFVLQFRLDSLFESCM